MLGSGGVVVEVAIGVVVEYSVGGGNKNKAPTS